MLSREQKIATGAEDIVPDSIHYYCGGGVDMRPRNIVHILPVLVEAQIGSSRTLASEPGTSIPFLPNRGQIEVLRYVVTTRLRP